MGDWTWLAVVLLVLMICAYTHASVSDRHTLELKALQAQVDKKYCEGEVTYLQLVKESKNEAHNRNHHARSRNHSTTK